jgi:hypothetical protein
MGRLLYLPDAKVRIFRIKRPVCPAFLGITWQNGSSPPVSRSRRAWLYRNRQPGGPIQPGKRHCIDTDQNSITRELVQAARTHREIKLVNVFRGLPIVYPATLLESGERGIAVGVHRYQSVCLELDRHTFIQSEVLPKTVTAEVAEVNLASTTAILTNLAYANNTIGNRTAIRVEPKKPTQVTISKDRRKFTGNLADISVDGLGLFILAMYVYTLDVLQDTATVQLELKLLDDKKELKLTGEIAYIREMGSALRLGVRIAASPDTEAQRTILQFVSQRQTEILREVKQLYDLFYRLSLERYC